MAAAVSRTGINDGTNEVQPLNLPPLPLPPGATRGPNGQINYAPGQGPTIPVDWANGPKTPNGSYIVPPTPLPGQPAAKSSTMPAGIDPALAAIYEKAGITPGDRGTGFADWQYWQGVGSSQYARLASDLAGTGTDNPEGTPGQGIWDNSGKGASGTGGNAGTTVGLSPLTTSLMSQSGLGGTAPGQATDLFNKLMSIGNESTDINPNDPVIKAQTDAYNAADTRSAKDLISKTAEKGGANSDIGATTRSAMEKVGQDTAGFTASAMQTELQSRRDQIQQALSSASGLLTADQQMELTQQLGLIDSALQKYGIDTQNSQFFSPFNPSYVG